MNKPLTIVIIRAPGYSGATWVNTVLGCHDRAMAMGPPNRFWKLGPEMADQACMIHRNDCRIWPELIKHSPSADQWFNVLADVTGKDTFILNYPDREFYEAVIAPMDARVLHVKLMRDGRASLYSRMRHHHKDSHSQTFRDIMEWQIPKWDQVDRKLPSDPDDYFYLRYEDLIEFPGETFDRLGQYIGIDYDPAAAMRFWEWEHHLTAGNVGMLDLICRLQGLEGYAHARRTEYDKVIERVKAGGPAVFLDESWKTGLTHEDRLVFDCLLGERNAAHGYERDSFTEAEKNTFWNEFDQRCARVFLDLADGDGKKSRSGRRTIGDRLVASVACAGRIMKRLGLTVREKI